MVLQIRAMCVPAARFLHGAFVMTVFVIFAGLGVVLTVLALVVQAIRRTAGVPSIDDPKQITPPPARDMSQNGRGGERL